MFSPYGNIRHAISPNNRNALATINTFDWSSGGKLILDDRMVTQEQLRRMRQDAMPLMIWPQTFDAVVEVQAGQTVRADLMQIEPGFYTDMVHYLIHVVGGLSFMSTVQWRFMLSGRAITQLSNFYAQEFEDQPMQARGGDVLQLMVVNSSPSDQILHINGKMVWRIFDDAMVTRGRS